MASSWAAAPISLQVLTQVVADANSSVPSQQSQMPSLTLDEGKSEAMWPKLRQ